MRNKWKVWGGSPALGLAICVFVTTLPATAQDGVMGRPHGEWVSGVLIHERPTRFRYLAEQMDAGAYTSFSVDIIEGIARSASSR